MTSKLSNFGSSCGYGWVDMGPASLKKNMAKMLRTFGKLKDELNIDAVAYSGSSGSVLAFAIALKYEVAVIYVRKDNEDSHGNKVECNRNDVKRYLIVDDFIDAGSTVERILQKIRNRARTNQERTPKCMGILLYDTCAREDMEGRHFVRNKLRIWAPNGDRDDE